MVLCFEQNGSYIRALGYLHSGTYRLEISAHFIIYRLGFRVLYLLTISVFLLVYFDEQIAFKNYKDKKGP